MSSAKALAVAGEKFTVEWATDSRDRMPALEYFNTLKKEERQRLMMLFKRLADNGDIANREHFKCLGEKGERLWEFKHFQLRFLGDYRSGRRFVIAHGLRKKRDELDPAAIARAKRILDEHDEREERARKKAKR